MRGRVVVKPREEFDTWLAAQPTFAEEQLLAAADPLAGAAQYGVCMACHGPSGEGNPSLNAPRLAGQQAWYMQRQLHAFRNGQRGAHANDTYGAQMRAFAAMLPDEAAIRNLAAYVETLPGHEPEPTVAGNVDRGRRLYTTCANCHGANGEGRWALNAPRLADMSDWYMVRQLQNFKQRIRGAHSQDYYGWQMATMADSLGDDRAINDIVAYINTLDPEAARTALANGRGN
jgi:cytochrome c oxidase subunit 2